MNKATLAEQLNQVHSELREAARAFPPELRTVRPAAEEWCAMELLGHTAEMHYSYVARAERVIATPGAPLGRDMASPERVQAIEGGRTANLEAALAELERARLHVLAFLERLTEEELAKQGNHQRLGPMTVWLVIERTIVGHARNHLEQLQQTQRALLATNKADGA